jgi:glycerophosphoryl diester phosphodiesterase
MTGASGAVAHLDTATSRTVKLSGSEETIPDLPEILRLIGGRAPLLIEVKSSGRAVAPLCRAVSRALDGYAGAVGVMSFDPEVGHWFARQAPGVLRGLVVTEAGKGWRGPIERQLAAWRARPEFLGYDIRDLPSRFAARQRAAGLAVFTWTCRGDAHRSTAALHADQIIYEDL